MFRLLFVLLPTVQLADGMYRRKERDDKGDIPMKVFNNSNLSQCIIQMTLSSPVETVWVKKFIEDFCAKNPVANISAITSKIGNGHVAGNPLDVQPMNVINQQPRKTIVNITSWSTPPLWKPKSRRIRATTEDPDAIVSFTDYHLPIDKEAIVSVENDGVKTMQDKSTQTFSSMQDSSCIDSCCKVTAFFCVWCM